MVYAGPNPFSENNYRIFKLKKLAFTDFMIVINNFTKLDQICDRPTVLNKTNLKLH